MILNNFCLDSIALTAFENVSKSSMKYFETLEDINLLAPYKIIIE